MSLIFGFDVTPTKLRPILKLNNASKIELKIPNSQTINDTVIFNFPFTVTEDISFSKITADYSISTNASSVFMAEFFLTTPEQQSQYFSDRINNTNAYKQSQEYVRRSVNKPKVGVVDDASIYYLYRILVSKLRYFTKTTPITDTSRIQSQKLKTGQLYNLVVRLDMGRTQEEKVVPISYGLFTLDFE